MTQPKRIEVTSPLLPPLDELNVLLKEIWESKWITNNMRFHAQLEKELADYLKVPYISLYANGTLPLMAALKMLNVTGEVITTPYSFVATSHTLWWEGTKPVFVDIDPATCALDPAKIEAAITPHTTAIMPVHCYGIPCDTRAIDDIARRHGLKVIYDAAHAFGVEVDGQSLLNAGDISTISFHATKVFNTIEGGAMILPTRELKEKADFLKNFGFANDTTVVCPGINGKLDEVRAAYGLINLRHIDEAITARKLVTEKYRDALRDVEGITFFNDTPGIRANYGYFPIMIDEEQYGMSRDQLYSQMLQANIYSRRYFYPLISEFAPYNTLPSATPENLPQAHKVARSILCLPLHHEISDNDIERVVDIIRRR